MQKRKLLITIVAILTISLIGLAATCLAPSEAPTLELEIYDGPDYSESDNMCYYRVEAKATGMPESEIEFDEDDNVTLLGSGRVEVGVEVGDTYTLTATATNSAGTATVSIVLEGECGVESADADDDADDDADADSDADDDADADADADSDADDDADTDADDDADVDVAKEEPTISIAVYEGPTLEGSICYYRIEATVTGSPNPNINFSKDDSGGAWLPKRVQVNINNPGDTYTLTATATNSEGSATDSIDLSWGCAIPEPDPVEVSVDIALNNSISGYIVVTSHFHTGLTREYVYVGDYTNDKQIKTFLTFDINSISSLADVTIKDATLIMPVLEIVNNPETMPEVHFKTFDYGDSLEMGDQGAGGDLVGTIPTSSTMASFNFSSSQLEAALQNAVDSNSQRYQLKISLSGINADGNWDYYTFLNANVKLNVKYEVPG